jgi:hypothetical protein
MDRDEIIRQGKQTASDLRDTVSQKVSDNEDTIKGTLGKAARWVDEKTGGKYSEQIGKVESRVGDGIGWVASQSPSTPASGTPGAPGAAAGDPAPGAGTTPPPGTTPPGPITPDEGAHAAAPHAAASPDVPTPPRESAPGTTPPGPITSDDDGDLPPRPPQV